MRRPPSLLAQAHLAWPPLEPTIDTPRFESWKHAQMLRGQHSLADTVRELVYKTAPDVFDALDFNNDQHFLNPLLFAWFTSRDKPSALKDIVFSNQRFVRIKGTPLHVCQEPPAVFTDLFAQTGSALPDALPNNCFKQRCQQLTLAMDLISRHCVSAAKFIHASTRLVMLFEAPMPNSFASLSAHGAVFFNVPQEAHEVFFLEDLAHQCAHVAFNAMTLNKQRYFAIDAASSIGEIAGDAQEPRTVYTVLHALYTYTLIGQVLTTMLQRSVFEGQKAHELKGRFAYTLEKFAFDLALMARPGILSAKGLLVLRRFDRQYQQHLLEHGWWAADLDLTNQPYNFSYEHFSKRNPLTKNARAA